MATINSNKMPIIKNIGYLWHRKYVNWQSGRDLIGNPDGFPGTSVNFADQAGIYVLYDRNLQPIYIGQAGKGNSKGLYDRLKDHTEDYLFCAWERFSWYGFYSRKVLEDVRTGKLDAFNAEYEIETNAEELVNVMESILIRICRPSFNMASGTLCDGRGNNIIEWYYQEAEWEEQQEEFDKLKNRKLSKKL